MKKWYLLFASVSIITFTTCEKEGKEGIKSLVKISNISSNDNCTNGGQKIETGLDSNRNSLLDPSEVESTNYICNGSNGIDGLNSLTNLAEVNPTNICEAGGFKIDVGIDKNRNNILDVDEIESAKYICNGINGGYDKQIMFQLGGLNSLNKDTFIYDSRLMLFNKSNYTKIDSAILVVYGIRTKINCCDDSNVAKTLKVELYDLTNKRVIDNSIIESDDIPHGSYIKSKNFISNLPNGNVDFGLRLIFDKNYYAFIEDSYLVLYRSK